MADAARRYEIVWSAVAVDRAAGFLADDATGLAALLDRIDALAVDPRPFDAVPVVSPALQRLRFGRYRVLYEIVDDDQDRDALPDDPPRVVVVHVGRI